MSPRLLGLLALSALLAWGLAQTEVGKRLETGVSDRFFVWRHQLRAGPQVHGELVIVTIDEATYDFLEEPAALWLPYFAELGQAAFEGGAARLIFDWIPSYAPPELFRPFGELLLAHREEILMAVYAQKTPDGLRRVTPAGPIVAVLGDERLGLVNMPRDFDGVARRFPTGPLKVEGRGYAPLSVLASGQSDPPAQVLIDYAGLPGETFPTVSMTRVLKAARAGEETQLKDWFENKTVLLGTTANLDQDFVETPFRLTNSVMAGVEVHAHLLNTLADPHRLRSAGTGQVLGLVVLVAGLALALAHLPHAFHSVGGLLALGVGWFGLSFKLFLSGLLVPVTAPLVGLAFFALGSFIHRSQHEERRRRHLREVFGRYVCPEVMEEMLKVSEDHRPELAQRKEVVVMFSDINDFSTSCEKLEPEEVTRRLNAYFQEMSEILYQYRGTIIRFIGDEFMVLFGAPMALENKEEAATRAAVEMVERLNRLREQDPNEENGFYHVKVGIHVGELILTSIGGERRSDYNCVGDSANMAARVLGLTKPTDSTVLISDDVYERVAHLTDLNFVDKGEHPVKGRKGKVRIYDVSKA